MSYRFLFVYRKDETENWSLIEGTDETKKDFLKRHIDKSILKQAEWVVYRIDEGTHKDQYLHSGEIDDLYPK